MFTVADHRASARKHKAHAARFLAAYRKHLAAAKKTQAGPASVHARHIAAARRTLAAYTMAKNAADFHADLAAGRTPSLPANVVFSGGRRNPRRVPKTYYRFTLMTFDEKKVLAAGENFTSTRERDKAVKIAHQSLIAKGIVGAKEMLRVQLW